MLASAAMWDWDDWDWDNWDSGDRRWGAGALVAIFVLGALLMLYVLLRVTS
jgi:hypothetical protein